MTVSPKLALLPLALSILACGSSGSPSPTGLAAPSLQTPGDNEQIRQNDPTTGCAFSPTHGYGFQVAFTWTPVPEAVHYHLLLIHDGAQYPALDTQVDEPSYLMRFCNAYVIDANRFGWHWTATAVTEDGEDGIWAEQRNYEFEPIALPPVP
jgi:hypothetical protein